MTKGTAQEPEFFRTGQHIQESGETAVFMEKSPAFCLKIKRNKERIIGKLNPFLTDLNILEYGKTV